MWGSTALHSGPHTPVHMLSATFCHVLPHSAAERFLLAPCTDAEGPSDGHEGQGLFGSHLSGPMSPRMPESPAGESPHAAGEKGWELLARVDDTAAKTEDAAGVHKQPSELSNQAQDAKVEKHNVER